MFKTVGKLFASKEDPKKRKTNIRKNTEIRASVAAKDKTTPTAADIDAGRALFWGKKPYYPAMGSAYRSLMQRFKVDTQRAIKVHEVTCGADLCAIASGAGPYIDYGCADDDLGAISKQIDTFDLGKKIDRVLDDRKPREYFAQILSFMPKDVDDAALDWDHFGETTLPGGLVIILKKIEVATNSWTPKPSQKISDTNEFYYYNQIDHTNDWIKGIEARLKAVGEMDAAKFDKLNRHAVGAFKIEASEWMLMLQRLKTGDLKIISAIYKHDDI